MLDFLLFVVTVLLPALPLLGALRASRSTTVGGGSGPALRSLWPRLALALLGFGLWIFIRWYFGFYTDLLWWREDIRHPEAFWTLFWARLGQGLLFSVPAVLFVAANLWVARGGTRGQAPPSPPARLAGRLAMLAFVYAAFRHGLSFGQEHWSQILLWKNRVPFNLVDPIFHKDAGFYVFAYPFLKLLADWARDLVFLAMVASAVVYLVRAGSLLGVRLVAGPGGKAQFAMAGGNAGPLWNRVLTHEAVLGALLMVGLMIETRLATWGLMYSTRGAVFGPGYTDVHVMIPAYNVMLVALGIGIVLLLRAALSHSLAGTVRALVAGGGLVVAVWVVGLGVVPGLIQRYKVSPNETTLEIPYIQHNMKFTRVGFALTDDRVEVRDFPPLQPLTRPALEADSLTLSNIRLWDWRALEATYNQNQSFRQYYDFQDVDIDRYRVGGRLRQVMLSLRELNQSAFSANAATWVNLRQVYTHGYGLCMNPTSELSPEGLPNYWVKDIPPVVSDSALKVDRPEIYYGELMNAPVYVHTGQKEFGYPKGEENVYASYEGKGGVALGSGLRRLALAMRFDGLRQLTSADLRADSRLMFRRNILTRLRTAAPFLSFDEDPYAVLAGGRLFVMVDGYTASSYFPYAERMEEGVNYVRNAVKATVDCYDGTVHFYIFDDADPIIRAWQKAFPALLEPAGAMPPTLRAHVRYPEDFLKAQARAYATYHMNDPMVFYNKEDRWAIARENAGNDVGEMLPYYAVMKLPGEAHEEFVQMIPFTPFSVTQPKNNMVAWMAGRCDGADHGKLLVYKFPKQTLIYGPMQIEARIDQDAVISKDLSLWNQQGSSVIRGNLIVLPLASGLLYTEPLFLQATHSRMPELKRVVVASQEKLGYGENFPGALSDLLGEQLTPQLYRAITGQWPDGASALGAAADSTGLRGGGPAGDQTTGGGPARVGQLPAGVDLETVRAHYRRYLELSGSGRLEEAGRELQKIGELLGVWAGR